MRPITLNISGLHSFRALQTIDFTCVTDAGLFGIFGPTGSGKSTILDAMTLALYGKVERSGGNRHGILNQHEPRLHVALTFEIAHNGSRQRYRVERTYKRKDAYSIQSTHSRLIVHGADGDVVLEDKDTAVTEAVRQIIGLNVDDFTRAVVLPQGKFAEFLKLKGKERRDMLERIFCLDTYGEWLREQATRHLQGLRQQVAHIMSKQEMLGEATHEAVTEAKQLYKESLHMCTQLESEKTVYDQEYDVWRNVWQHQQELTEISGKMAQLEYEGAEIRATEHLLEQAERANQVYPFIQTYREWQEHVNRTIQELEQAEVSLREFEVKREEAQAAFAQAQSDWEEQSPRLSEQKAEGGYAVTWEEERDVLAQQRANNGKMLLLTEERHDVCRSKLTTAEKRIHVLAAELQHIQKRLAAVRITTEERQKTREAEIAQQELTTKQQQLDQSIQRCETKRADFNKATERWTRVAEQLAKQEAEQERLQRQLQAAENRQPFQECDLQRREADLRERAHHINQVTSLLAESRKAEAEKRQLDSDIRGLERKREQYINEWQGIRQTLTAKHAERTACEVQIATRDRQQLAVQLVTQLSTGDPCPVCGSREHPRPASTFEADTLSEWSKTVEHVNREIGDLEQQLAQLDAAIAIQNNTITHKTEWLEKTDELWQAKKQQLDQLLQTFPDAYRDATDSDAMLALLSAERQQLERDSTTYTDWQDACKQLAADVQKNQSAYQDLREAMIEAEAAQRNARLAVQEVELTVAERREQFHIAQAAWDAVKGHWTAETLAERISEIADWDTERERLEQQREQTEREHHHQQQQHDQAQREMHELTSALQGIQSEQRHIEQGIDQLDEKIYTVTGGKPAQQYLQEVAAAETLMKQRLSETKACFHTVDQNWQEAQRAVTVLTAKKDDQEQQLTAATAKVQHQLQKYEFITVAEAEEARLTEAEWQRMRQRVDAYKELQKQLQHDRDRLEKQLNGRFLNEADWNEMTAKKQSLDEMLEQAKADVIRYDNAYQSKKQDYARWQGLEQARITTQREVDHASDLHNVLKGNTFVEFIAREHLIHIAADASKHLGELTRYRYALEIDRDGGFVMRDDANGGLLRPVSTLSGGETFLTSLSLALALSSQIQLKGECPLEFFFLDEGFGTLDAELLDVVITALEKRHFKHMTIGLISHVPELQNRLHRKILVTPAAASTGEGTKVQVANA